MHALFPPSPPPQKNELARLRGELEERERESSHPAPVPLNPPSLPAPPGAAFRRPSDLFGAPVYVATPSEASVEEAAFVVLQNLMFASLAVRGKTNSGARYILL